MAKKVEFNWIVVKKYIFWACTPIGLIVALVAGVMAINSVSGELEDMKKRLDSLKKTMEGLNKEAKTHPNQRTIDAVKEERGKLTKNVLAAWQTLEKDQKEQNRWTGLADRAVQEIEKKNFLDSLEGATLDSYLTFARNEINKLLEKSNIRRVQQYAMLADGNPGEPLEPINLTENSGGGMGMMGGRGTGGTRGGMGMPGMSRSTGMTGGGMTMGGGGMAILSGKVVWDQPGLDFTMKDWENRPQSFQVWLTQEDLWVYQSLLWVVAESNKFAPEPSKRVMAGSMGAGGLGGGMMGTTGGGMGAGGFPLSLKDSVVKQIIDLAIGQQAAMSLSSQSSRRISSGMGGGMGMGMGMGMSGMSSGMGSGMGMPGMSSGGMGMPGMSSGGMGMPGMGSGMGMPGMSSGGMGMGMGMSGMSSGGMSSGMGMGSGMGGVDANAAAEMAKSYALMARYVDGDGNPMDADSALAGQFRRMPIYLCFLADQRYISDILVNCANCPMPIDVLWVTINPDATQPFEFVPNVATTGTGGMGGLGGLGGGTSMMGSPSRGMGGTAMPGGTGRGGRSGTGMLGGRGSGGMMGTGMGRGGGSSDVDYGPHAVQIEIYGCINIFAPPDEEKIEAPPESASGKGTGTGMSTGMGMMGTRPGMSTGMGTMGTRPGMGMGTGTGTTSTGTGTRPATGAGAGR